MSEENEGQFKIRFENGPWFCFDDKQRETANLVASHFIRNIDEAKNDLMGMPLYSSADSMSKEEQEVIQNFFNNVVLPKLEKWFGKKLMETPQISHSDVANAGKIRIVANIVEPHICSKCGQRVLVDYPPPCPNCGQCFHYELFGSDLRCPKCGQKHYWLGYGWLDVKDGKTVFPSNILHGEIGGVYVSYHVDGSIAKILMPVSPKLMLSSLLSTLQKFEKWKLLNICVVLTGQGVSVEFIFSNLNVVKRVVKRD